jgi:hypothetical protein
MREGPGRPIQRHPKEEEIRFEAHLFFGVDRIRGIGRWPGPDVRRIGVGDRRATHRLLRGRWWRVTTRGIERR